jgi:hypothetical protein
MKKLLLSLFFLGLVISSRAQECKIDTMAIVVLDHMSAIIGDLQSCSFRLSAETDVADPDLGFVTNHEVSNVWFSGPDKMLIETWGKTGHRCYWYNGQTLTWYSFSENNYVVIDVPGKTIAMIDSVNDTYGIDFPAADFFYPTFTDDLIGWSEKISFMGRTNVDNKSCYQISARNKEANVQMWISDNALFLPLKFMISYNGEKSVRRYEAIFSDWQIGITLPDSMFEFAIPPGARQVSIMSRK